MKRAHRHTDSILATAPARARFVFNLFNEQKLHPFYGNKVKNIITGVSYEIPHYQQKKGKKRKFFQLVDIPEYLSVKAEFLPANFKTKSIRQYKGFLVDLDGFSTEGEYLAWQLSKRSRKRLRKKMVDLTNNHSVSYDIYCGHIDRQQHEALMEKLAHFLKKRFDEKKMRNKYLDRWSYYCELSYEKINQKLASLFVIKDSEKPICITLNFHLEDTVFSELESFDTDYSDYSLGDISMSKHLQWCLENKVKILDLSMGETHFKNKWCNRSYDFHYHLHYNKKSLISLLMMLVQWSKLNLKQFLRDLGILGGIFRYDRLLYMLKNR